MSVHTFIPTVARASCLLGLFALAGCRRRELPPQRPALGDTIVATPVAPPPAANVPTGQASAPEGSCTPPPPPVTASHWDLVGYHPGPGLQDVLAVGAHHRTLVATTRTEVCTSVDGGATWVSRLGATESLAAPSVVELPALDAVVTIAQGTRATPTAPRVFVSRDLGSHWEPLAIPAEAGARARVFTDRERRLWVVSPTKLWLTSDVRTFEGPHTLPGSESDEVDACGSVLIARAKLGPDQFYHRSDDRGATWRPFRLGMAGLEGNHALMRCLGWRGGIEAGRAPLPSQWSFDGGRTWESARYDDTARRVARTLADNPDQTGEAPHCAGTPFGELACMDTHRLMLPDEDGDDHEIVAPASCDRVRMIDDRRALAFGPSCGVYVSTDRGGMWRSLATSLDPSRMAPGVPSGRGGFINARSAWRIDEGVWWTDDGGAHWRLVPAVNSRALGHGVFVDRTHGVFQRADGWLVSTKDGGRTWTWVLQAEVERITSAGQWVMITTSDRVRVSPNGGETWRASVPFPTDVRPDPTLEIVGSQRRFEPTPGAWVSQQGDRITLTLTPTTGGTPHTTEIVRGLPRGYDLLAAHATNGAIDRVLLTGGAVLRHDPTHEDLPQWEVRASRPSSHSRRKR